MEEAHQGEIAQVWIDELSEAVDEVVEAVAEGLDMKAAETPTPVVIDHGKMDHRMFDPVPVHQQSISGAMVAGAMQQEAQKRFMRDQTTNQLIEALMKACHDFKDNKFMKIATELTSNQITYEQALRRGRLLYQKYTSTIKSKEREYARRGKKAKQAKASRKRNRK